jgi:hypothetical protein
VKAEASIICRYLIGKVPNILCYRQVSWLVDLLNTFPPMRLSPVIGSGHCRISVVRGSCIVRELATFHTPNLQLPVSP